MNDRKRLAQLTIVVVLGLTGCGTTGHTYRFTATGFEPTWSFEFDSDTPGELEEVWTPDSSLWRFTTDGYVMHIDIGMRSWLDRSRESGYSLERINRPFPEGELVRFEGDEKYMPGLPYRALMQWEKTSVRPWVNAATEADRERGIAAMRSLRTQFE